MTWFEGGIAQAIASARSDDKMFLVYIHGNDDDSKTLTNECFGNDQVKTLLQKTCVCVKLENGSEAFKQFAEIYPVMIIPVTFVIGKDGIPLEILGGSISARELTEKINNAYKTYKEKSTTTFVASTEGGESVTASEDKKVPQEASGFSDDETHFVEETPSTSKVDDEKQDSKEKAKALQEKMNRKRIQRLKDAEQAEQEKEIERRNLGKAVSQMKEKQKEIQLKKDLEERRKEKQSEKEALKRVKEQIEQDRIARNEKFRKQKEERDAEEKRKRDEKASLQNEEKQRERAKIARIQFRLPNGATLTRQYPREASMGEMIDDLRSQAVQLPPDFRLSVRIPRRVFQPEDYDKSLSELDLAPNASLFVQPFSSSAMRRTPDTGVFQKLIDLLLLIIAIPVNILSSLWSMLSGPAHANNPQTNQPATPDSPAPSAGSAGDRYESSLRRRNVRDPTETRQDGKTHRLSDIKREDDDSATWNGNSTQQM